MALGAISIPSLVASASLDKVKKCLCVVAYCVWSSKKQAICELGLSLIVLKTRQQG